MAELVPGVSDEKFGDFEFGKLTKRRADLEVWRDVGVDVVGEGLLGFPGFRPLVVYGKIVDIGVRLGAFVADRDEDLGFVEEDSLNDGERLDDVSDGDVAVESALLCCFFEVFVIDLAESSDERLSELV